MVKISDAQSASRAQSAPAAFKSPNGPAPEGPGEVHTVQRGETLRALAEEYLGDEELWTEIAKVNPQIKNPNLIFPGDQVRIPALDDAFYERYIAQHTGMGDQQGLANFASGNDQAALVAKKQTGTLEFLQQKNQLAQGADDVSTPRAKLDRLLQDNPQLETNQDFINHCYRHGDNNWNGASEVAAGYGLDLNHLVRDRSAALRSGQPAEESPPPAATASRPDPAAAPATTPVTTPATTPVTNPGATGAELEAFPIAGGRYNIGYDRDWNNFDPSTATHNSDFSNNPTDANHPRGHQGVDIFAPRGEPVVAPVTGVIESAGHTSVGGNCVTIRRGEERFYLAHLDSLADLRPGQSISAGDPVGTVGNTGNAQGTAPHLHFSIYRGSGGYYSNAINPFPYLMAAR
ncbi:MAG: peptidoglycan DD-metalloendopeptidase family protein [Deltaproteobacteria bacterium]|nr:peptidoglycan DD-metalloendopeptidase family protein [Deltaproteobacteria bacterium]